MRHPKIKQKKNEQMNERREEKQWNKQAARTKGTKRKEVK
jgi:hypothetical protein